MQSVRVAKVSDLDIIMSLCIEYQSLPGIKNPIDLDVKHLRSYLEIAIKDYSHDIFITEDNNGFLFAVLSSMPWSPVLIGMDHLFYVRPESRGSSAIALIRAFEQWSKLNGAKYVTLGLASGVNHDKVARFYRFKGYRENSISMTKEI